MCRDAELPAADYVGLVLRGAAVETDLTAVNTVLGGGWKAATAFSPAPAARRAVQQTWQDGVRTLLEAADRARITSSPSPGRSPRPRPRTSAADDLWRLAGRRRRPGRPGDRHRAALDAGHEPGPTGSAGRGGDRGRAGAGQDGRRCRARRGGAGRAPERRGEGGGLACRCRAERRHRDHPAGDLSGVLAARPGRRAGTVRRSLLRDGRRHLGRRGVWARRAPSCGRTRWPTCSRSRPTSPTCSRGSKPGRRSAELGRLRRADHLRTSRSTPPARCAASSPASSAAMASRGSWPTVGEVAELLEDWFPPSLAESLGRRGPDRR